MANQYVMGLNKKSEDLGNSGVVKLPEAEVTVFYVEGKDLASPKEPRMKLLFVQQVEKSFEPRGKADIERARKAIEDANAKAERAWESSDKDDVELAKVVKGMERAVMDACAELEKKLLMSCKIAVEEGRKVGGFSSTIESHASVKLAGKVTESPDAKSAMGAAMDSADAKSEAARALLKLLDQMQGDLKEGMGAAQKSVAPLAAVLGDTNDMVNDMKAFAKSKGVKESLAVKVGTTTIQKNLKLVNNLMADANSFVWEAQRRLKLVEKEAKTLKSTPVMGQLKACDAAMEKAEEPLREWLKGKPQYDMAMKAWDTKSVRDYTKLALLLKNLKQDDVGRGFKVAIEQGEKLRGMVEEAAKG